jgi:hypothetical protein
MANYIWKRGFLPMQPLRANSFTAMEQVAFHWLACQRQAIRILLACW